jgi:hypothetical protein
MELLGEWIMWNLVLVHLETMLVSMQYRCTVFAEHTLGSEIIFWTHLTILLGHEAQLEACLSLFGDSGNLDASGLCRMYRRLGNRLRRTRWNS